MNWKMDSMFPQITDIIPPTTIHEHNKNPYFVNYEKKIEPPKYYNKKSIITAYLFNDIQDSEPENFPKYYEN